SMSFHPVTNFRRASTGVAVERSPAPPFRKQGEPDATRKRAQCRHGNIIGDAWRIRVGELENERVGNQRKRKNRRIKESYDEKSAGSQAGDEMSEARWQFELLHTLTYARGNRAIVAEA